MSEKTDRICVIITVITLLITVLFINGEKLGIKTVSNENSTDADFTENDMLYEWDTSGATLISLDSLSVRGNGAYFENEDLHIVYAGKYVLSGALNGTVTVDADGDDKIWLMLDNADITNESECPLYIEQADKVFLTLAENTDNSITRIQCSGDETVDGAIYSRDDLTVNGNGSLSVRSDSKHGIVCNDTLKFTGGNINITAAADGVHAHDAIKIKESSITVSAGDDALHAASDDGISSFVMESGNITVTDCAEGIEANTVTVNGGNISVTFSDDGINACGESESSVITVNGGSITLLSPDGRDADGLDSNGSIYINGGDIFISVNQNGGSAALDCGSENGGVCLVNGGTVIACGSSAMAEGFDPSSSQGFVMASVSGNADSDLCLSDENGNTLISAKIPYAFSSAVLSTAETETGKKVILSIDNTETELTVGDSSYGKNRIGFGNMPGNGRGFQSGNMQPPEMPDGGFPQGENGQPPEMPDGSFPQGENGQPPEMPENIGGDFTRNGGNKKGEATASTEESQAKTSVFSLGKNLIPVAVSVVVLAVGIAVAKKKY